MKDKGSRVKKRSLELADPRKEFIRETRETEMIKLTKKVNERYEFFEEVARKVEVLRTTEKIASFFSLSLSSFFLILCSRCHENIRCSLEAAEVDERLYER